MKKSTLILLFIQLGFSSTFAQNKDEKRLFTESFMQDSCTFVTTGRNPYFILEPGYQLILEGIDEKDTVRLVITVLHETKKVGGVDTRIVEENESVNRKTIEVSRNYFAICKQTNNVFYFGEDVDMYKDGKVINHSGAWLAEGKNKAGIIMPGTLLLGSRFYEEIAPDVAMDRAEIISMNEKVNTPAGSFYNCLMIEETTPLEPKAKEYKFHAPGIGLVKDGELMLVKWRFVK